MPIASVLKLRSVLFKHAQLPTYNKKIWSQSWEKKKLLNRSSSYFSQTNLALFSQGEKNKTCPNYRAPVSH